MICLLNIKTVKLAQIHGQLFEKYEEKALNSVGSCKHWRYGIKCIRLLPSLCSRKDKTLRKHLLVLRTSVNAFGIQLEHNYT